MNKGRVSFVAMLGVAMLCLVSVAWACTPRARAFGLSIGAAPRESTVTLTGEGVIPKSVVDIRWNSLDGRQLGTSTADLSGNFALSFNVPDVAPGIYYILAVPAGQDIGAGQDVGRLAFEVTSPTSRSDSGPGTNVQATSTDLWSGFSPETHVSESRAFSPQDSSGPNKASAALGIGLLAAGSLALIPVAGALVRRRTYSAS